jgi:hypothetical protein
MTEKLSIKDSQRIRGGIIKTIGATLVDKAEEYVRNDDMLHNFNEGARQSGMMRERVLEYFRLKHMVSRNDIINDLETKGILPSKAKAYEKYGDIINYYILELESIIHRIEVEEDERTN